MNVETGMSQIREAIANTVGTQNYDDSTEESYRQTLEEVDSIAGGSAVEEVVGWVSGEVRDEEAIPSQSAAKEHAAQICRDHDADIPSSSRLANA